MMTGNSIFCAARSPSLALRTGCRLPERIGMPARWAIARAAILSPNCSKSSGRGPTKIMPDLLAGAGQVGILGEEAVARMNRVDSPLFGERDERGDIEVRADRLAGTADEIGLVGLQPVQSETVFVGINSDRADAQLMTGPEDPDGNFTAIRDEKSGDSPH